MLMASLTRRLQVLLDEERWLRLERESRRRGTSVATLVRDAIDQAIPDNAMTAAEAATWFLDQPPLELGDWDQAKAEIEDGMARGWA